MAKDDYHVVVFRILKYLYQQLKKGLPVETEMLLHDSKICNINESYWRYIMTSMQEKGLITGLEKGEGEPYAPLETQLKDVQITPDGIDLLSDSKMSDKVDQLIKGILSIG